MKRFVTYLIIALLLAALLPYVIICFYTLPFADDFCFGWTASANIPFYQKFLNQYLQWNGRYTADVLCNLHPLTTGRILYYQLAVLVSLLAMPVILWWFVREMLLLALKNASTSGASHRLRQRRTKGGASFLKDAESAGAAVMSSAGGGVDQRSTEVDGNSSIIAFKVSLLLTLFYLNYQPNVTEGLYWFIGIANYHWGLLTFLLHLTLLLKALKTNGTFRWALLLPALLLLVISIGFNEVGALLMPVLYAIALALHLKSENRKIWIALFVTAILASAFVFFSPGNFIRGNEFKDNYNLLHSLLYASLQTARFIATWMFTIPFILLSLLVLAHAGKVRPQFFKQADYRLIAVFMLFTVFAGSFLPYFATGVLGQHRTINFVFFLFLLLWPLFLLSISLQSSFYQRLQLLKKPIVTFVILVSTIGFMLTTANSGNIIGDYFNSKLFQGYRAEFLQRQETILLHPDLPIKELESIPNVFTIVDVRTDTTWWVDKCMQKFYIETKMELK